MASPRGSLRIPSVATVVDINRLLTGQHRGHFEEPDNLRYRASLEWALEFVQRPSFMPDPYPTLIEKAAYIGWCITAHHYFLDGNKRTGSLTAALILTENGYQFTATANEIIQIAKAAADPKSGMTYGKYRDWLMQHSAPIAP